MTYPWNTIKMSFE